MNVTGNTKYDITKYNMNIK